MLDKLVGMFKVRENGLPLKYYKNYILLWMAIKYVKIIQVLPKILIIKQFIILYYIFFIFILYYIFFYIYIILYIFK